MGVRTTPPPFKGEHLTTLEAFAEQRGMTYKQIIGSKKAAGFPQAVFSDAVGQWYQPHQLRTYFDTKGRAK
jgi:hypothetical protein